MIKGICWLGSVKAVIGLTVIRAPTLCLFSSWLWPPLYVVSVLTLVVKQRSSCRHHIQMECVQRKSQDCFWELAQAEEGCSLPAAPCKPLLANRRVSWLRPAHLWLSLCAKRDEISAQLQRSGPFWSWGRTPRLHGERESEEETSESLQPLPLHKSRRLTFALSFILPPQFLLFFHIHLRYDLLFRGFFAFPVLLALRAYFPSNTL